MSRTNSLKMTGLICPCFWFSRRFSDLSVGKNCSSSLSLTHTHVITHNNRLSRQPLSSIRTGNIQKLVHEKPLPSPRIKRSQHYVCGGGYSLHLRFYLLPRDDDVSTSEFEFERSLATCPMRPTTT